MVKRGGKKKTVSIKKLLKLEVLISILVLIGILIILVKVFIPSGFSLTGYWSAAETQVGNISTATFDGADHIMNLLASNFFLHPNETRIYVAENDNISQYDCSIPGTLSSCSFSTTIFNRGQYTASIFFNATGDKMYEVGSGSNDKVYQYTCSTPWDLSSCSYDNVNATTPSANSGSIFFRPSGENFYIINSGIDKIYQYNCSAPWDLSSCVNVSQLNVVSQDSTPLGLFFNSSGTGIYTSGTYNWRYYEYTCSDAWNLSSCSYSNRYYNAIDQPAAFTFNSTGTRLYELGGASYYLTTYTCSAPWNRSSCISDLSESTLKTQRLPSGLSSMFFNGSGTKFYELNSQGDSIYQCTCSEAWDISSCVFDNVNISALDSTSYDIFFNSSGTGLYELGSIQRIYQSTCSDPWNVSSCSYISKYLTVTDGQGMFFNSTGEKLYVIGPTNALIYQYTCTIPWNISSCSYDNINISTQFDTPNDIFFNQYGNRLYEAGWNSGGPDNGGVAQYNCTIPWNLSSCSYTGVIIRGYGYYNNNWVEIFFNPNETSMYLGSSTSNAFFQYTLESEYISPFTCSNCTDCNNAITNASAGDTIYLNTSILATDNCINLTNKENITFDCLGNSIAGVGGIGIDYGIYLYNSHNNIIRNCNVTYFMAMEVYIYESNNNTIENMILTDTVGGSGLYLGRSQNNIVINISSSGHSDHGIHFYENNFTWIEDSNLFNNIYGVFFYGAINSTLTKTNISLNTHGIYINTDFDYNVINDSRIYNNSIAGIYLEDNPNFASYNTFYNNIFNNSVNHNSWRVDNYFNTTNQSGTNIMGGPFIGGNYWGNWSAPGTGFSDTCNDTNYDGYCDTNYTINETSIDYLPLVFNYTTDSTAPAVTINSPTNTTYASSTITMNVTATDSGSSVSSCWYTLNAGTTNYTLTNSGDDYTVNHASLSNQLYTAQFYCNDTLNNLNNTESVSFTVSVAAAEVPTGGGGGGGVTTGQPTSTLSFTTVIAGTPVSTIVNNADIDLTKMTITTNQDISDASITVTTIDVLPQADIQIGLPGGTAYQAFKIDLVGFTDDNIDEVILEFKVNKSWITEQGGTFDQISLFRKPDTANQWDALPTNMTSQDDDYYYFTATSPGFSEFTIFLLSKLYCETPGEIRCNGNLTQLCLANYEWRNIKLCLRGCVDGECNEEPLYIRLKEFFSELSSTTPGVIALSILIFLISLGVILVVYEIIQQKYKGRKILKKT